MKNFTKQLIFIASLAAVLVAGGLAIKAGVGNLKVNPILGHDLDLDAKYYGQAANNGVHDITTQDISISAWVKVDVDATSYGQILNKGATASYQLDYNTTGKIRLDLYDGTDDYVITGTLNIRDNKWHHIVGVFDKDTAVNCKVFIDGVDNTASRTGTLANIDTLTNTGKLTIGATSLNVFKFDGQIRDVKLYYAAGDHWSDAQVLYQAQHPFDYSANAGTLTDYWRLDEGTGTTLYGKVNNLTLSNVLAWTTQPKIKMVKQENSTTTGNNPVGWWKMDEGTGQYAYDVSGNGNTGTLGTSTVADGADPTWTTGKLGKGLSFDGVDDYVDAGKGSSLYLGTGDFTQSAWIKKSSAGAGFAIYSKSWVGTGEWQMRIFIFTDNKIYVYLNHYTPTRYWVYGGSVADTLWHHIVVVRDITAGQLYVYKDGVRQTMTIAVNDAGVGVDVSQNSSLMSNTFGTFGGTGIMDDARIYNRALTAEEVAQMFNSTKDGYLGNIKVSTGLVGYWKLDDNNALTSVIDYSGKNNTGTAYSSTATSTSVLSTSTAMIGRAMSFDGSNDYISIANNANLQLTKAVTISVWINTPAILGTWGFVSKINGSGVGGYGLWVRSSGLVDFLIDYGASWDQVDSNTYVQSNYNHWQNWVATYDGNTLKIYYNGILDNTKTRVGSIDTTTLALSIGAIETGNYFNGLIDEVKIWNYARSAEQILQDYQRGLKGLP